jgi:hypothetical protein
MGVEARAVAGWASIEVRLGGEPAAVGWHGGTVSAIDSFDPFVFDRAAFRPETRIARRR